MFHIHAIFHFLLNHARVSNPWCPKMIASWSITRRSCDFGGIDKWNIPALGVFLEFAPHRGRATEFVRRQKWKVFSLLCCAWLQQVVMSWSSVSTRSSGTPGSLFTTRNTKQKRRKARAMPSGKTIWGYVATVDVNGLCVKNLASYFHWFDAGPIANMIHH